MGCCLVEVFLTGCDKNANNDEITTYYEINKRNSLNMFSPVRLSMLKSGPSELFRIVHISDAHLTTWSSNNHIQHPHNLLEAVQFANEPEAKINVVVDTGDHIGNAPETTRSTALKYLDVFTGALYNKGNNIPTFTSTGNHDANMLNKNHSEFTLSKADIYSHLTAKTNHPVHSAGAENYYYADVRNPMGGVVRIIALDVMDQESTKYNAQFFALFSQKQMDWFCHTALKENMTGNHSVIVLIHYPLSIDNEIRKYVSNEFLYDWRVVPEIVEAFRTKRELSQKYANRFDPSDSLSVAVSFKDVPGEFICYLGGHIHTYLNCEIEGFRNPDLFLPKQIMIIANNMSPSEKNPQSNIRRDEVGLRNNTFNLYAVDTMSKTIYITFFGATSFYYPNIIELSYL
jgi:predicted MPP superfamily phosphohydrolase